jgi:Tfp pilus assembly protein PilO
MGGSKLRSWHVMVIGLLACVLVGAGIFIVLIKPKQGELVTLDRKLKDAEAIVATKQQQEARLSAAEAHYAMLTADLERYMVQKMPQLSFKNRMAGMLEYWVEMTQVLGPKLQKWPTRTGVKMQSSISTPSSSIDPNAVSNSSFIVLPMGTISVSGSYEKILSHIRSWNKFDRLVQVDPVSISGTSPNLTAQYNLTVYIFPRETPGDTIGLGPMKAGVGGGMQGLPGGAPISAQQAASGHFAGGGGPAGTVGPH